MPIKSLEEFRELSREYYGKRLHTEQMTLIEDVMEKLRKNPELVSDANVRNDLERITEIEELFEAGVLDQMVDADVAQLTWKDRLKFVYHRSWPIALNILAVLIGAFGVTALQKGYGFAIIQWIMELFATRAHGQALGIAAPKDKTEITLMVMTVGFIALMVNWMFWNLVLVLTNKAKTFELATRMVTSTFYFLTGALTGFVGRGSS
jgi:hypothetical protein